MSTAPIPSIPDFELLRLIGSGAYGDVWLAKSATGAWRAKKIVWRHTFDDDRPFQREFEGIQRIERLSRDHPSQLALFHVGRNDAARCFYYVMELADPAAEVISDQCSVVGDQSDKLNTDPWLLRTDYWSFPTTQPHTLRLDLERHGRLPAARVLELGRALSEALAHLHGHGLVHRDIKPSNIIFVGGLAKLADIGLVTDAGDGRSIVGTEGYLAPEGPGTPQADLFALGKVLYEAATGLDRRQFPQLPPDLRAWPDASLVFEINEILLRTCATDQRERYQTADEMRADLELLWIGKSVKRSRNAERRLRLAIKSTLGTAMVGLMVGGWLLAASWRDKPLDPVTTGKNVGGYPPTTMRGTRNLEAWNHYKLGWFASLRAPAEGTVSAEHEFREAIRLDPKFALPYWGLFRARFGDTWLLTHAKSPDEFRGLAAKMIELDDGLAETHAVLGFIKFWEWNWVDAEREYREAIRLNPDCMPARIGYGFYLSCIGRTRESLKVLESARQVDPTFAQIVKMMGHAYYVDRDFTKALACYREACRIDPSFPDPHLRAAIACFALNDYRTAIDELETNGLKWGQANPMRTKQKCKELRDAFNSSGPDGFWRKRLEQATATLNPADEPYAFAQIYARLGDAEETFKYLEKAYTRHDELVYLIFDECWDPWRDEPRFRAVITKVGLAELEADWLRRLATRRTAQPQHKR